MKCQFYHKENRRKTVYFKKYFPATLKAKDGRIIKTVANNNLVNVLSNTVSGVFEPPAVKTIQIPIIPKSIDA